MKSYIRNSEAFQQANYSWLMCIFAVFCLCQFISGGLLYFYKVGLDSASTLAYYQGTEQAEKSLEKSYNGDDLLIHSKPNLPFFQPRSFRGLIEITCAHLAAYALLCFILTHFLRSLSKNAYWSNLLAKALFSFAILDLLIIFCARYGPIWFASLRLGILVGFVLVGTFSSLSLLWLALRRDFRKTEL